MPHSARIWNFLLGGKDNIEQMPKIRDFTRAGRGFLIRTPTYPRRESGIWQFLDLGTGLPTVDNTQAKPAPSAPQADGHHDDRHPRPHARASR